jgi:CPA1 family monovalent cation:H+ antiporter
VALFETLLLLALVATVFLQVSRGLNIPYPTVLAVAGVLVAALPWTPDIHIDPQLALALFIAPALLDAAYDMPLRTLRRFWVSIFALAGVAVLLTTAAVAWLAVAWAGIPLAAAIALGAIVAPPDAQAASAMLGNLHLPRRTVQVLTAESLLNDAVSLLIFGAAVAATRASAGAPVLTPMLALAVPGGIVLGYAVGRLYVSQRSRLAGTLGGTLAEFVTTFGTWVIAEHLRLSAVLAVVAYAMTIAHFMPARQSARDRVHSYSVWASMVFFLNVFAFFLLGMQGRSIVSHMDSPALWHAARFAGLVFATVVAVRLGWVLLYNRAAAWRTRARGQSDSPSFTQGLAVSWCGMRGLVTLATALALPPDFPAKDMIVLSALAVILGTLVVQGVTLGPLMRRLHFPPDNSYDEELIAARHRMLDAAATSLVGQHGDAAAHLRAENDAALDTIRDQKHPRHSHFDKLRRVTLVAKRDTLAAMRRQHEVEDDVFHELEEELDWSELAATPPDRMDIAES